MMKNTEWGAVAYLIHSKYGINDEIRINNNSNYLTGYAAADGTNQSSYPGVFGTAESVTLPYNTKTGYKATTTGNITGVYDMSGGAWEYMAAYSELGKSGLTAAELSTYEKYFDIYPSNSSKSTWNYRILGDAIGEMGPFYYYAVGNGGQVYSNKWYYDLSHFIVSSYPWFGRGGSFDSGVSAGQFNFNNYTGAIYFHVSTRLVLAVK